jgi:hypothetical protein
MAGNSPDRAAAAAILMKRGIRVMENSSHHPRQVKPSASVDRPGQEAFADFTTSDKFSRMCEVNL